MFFEKGGGGGWVGCLSTLDGTTRYHKKDPYFICHLHSAGGVGTTWGWGAINTSERFYPWAITVNGREDFCGKKRHARRKHFHCYFFKKATVLVSTRACCKAKGSKAPQDMQAGMFCGKQGVPSQLRPGWQLPVVFAYLLRVLRPIYHLGHWILTLRHNLDMCFNIHVLTLSYAPVVCLCSFQSFGEDTWIMS